MKSAPVNEEPESYIDCTGHLQVFFLTRVLMDLAHFKVLDRMPME